MRGGTTGYSYDATGRLAAILDQNGNTVVANTYDPVSGRVTGQKDALGDATAFVWNAATTDVDDDGREAACGRTSTRTVCSPARPILSVT